MKGSGRGTLPAAWKDAPTGCCAPGLAPQAAREGTGAVPFSAARSLSNRGTPPLFAKWAVFRPGLAGKAAESLGTEVEPAAWAGEREESPGANKADKFLVCKQ